MIASFARLFLANFTALGATFELSHRALSVVPVIVILYFFWYSLRQPPRQGDRPLPGIGHQTLYSFLAAITLVALMRFELGRADTVLAWGPLALLFLVLGSRLEDANFRLQSYVLTVMTFVRSWATNLTLTGAVFGMSQRLMTTAVVVITLAAATSYCMRHRVVFEALGRATGVVAYVDRYNRILFSSLATVLLAILLLYLLDSRWVTVAWAIESFLILILGFVFVERSLRLYGLALALICLVKLVVLDLQDVETLYRILSYIVLGAILLLMSLGYTRYQHLVRRYL